MDQSDVAPSDVALHCFSFEWRITEGEARDRRSGKVRGGWCSGGPMIPQDEGDDDEEHRTSSYWKLFLKRTDFISRTGYD